MADGKCSICGKPTNAPSGVCAICQMMGRVNEKINGGTDMAKDKQCSVEGCTNPYKTRGFCNKHYLQALSRGEIKTERRSWNSKKSQVSHARSQADKRENIGTRGGSAAEPERKITPPTIPLDKVRQGVSDNGKYIITVDFSRYPKLHERLLGLAEKEFRTPDCHLLCMLHQEFQEMEEKVCQ